MKNQEPVVVFDKERASSYDQRFAALQRKIHSAKLGWEIVAVFKIIRWGGFVTTCKRLYLFSFIKNFE